MSATVSYSTLVHSNRFIREIGYQILADFTSFVDDERYVRQLARGLSDNWSQVRMAASIAARQFLLTQVEKSGISDLVGKLLLCRVCLNRFYVAEGVRNYNQETWSKVISSLGLESGRSLVKKHITDFTEYYRVCCLT